MRAGSLLVLASVAGDASADRAQLAWLGGTDVLEDRNVELQTRITDRDDLGDTRIRETAVWSGLQIGITDRLELSLPVELSRFTAVGLEGEFSLRRYGVGVRYRMAERASAIVPVLRFEIDRDAVARDVWRAESDATVSWTRGRVFAAAGLGITAEASRGGLFVVVRPGGGATVEVATGLRIGGELHAELDRESGGTSWLIAGPSLAWTHGRFWLAATYGIGLQNISSAPRLVWAGAF